MDNEYSDYKEEEEPKKFQIKRWMVIVGIAVLILIVAIILIIVIHKKNQKPKMTAAACEELESRMAEEASVYIENNSMEITEDITRIDFTELLDTNGGNIVSSKIAELDTVKGYVNVYQADGENEYDPYIMCSNVYKTAGYKEEDEEIDNKPVIKLNGKSKISIYVGDTYVDEGATASDKEDGDLTDSIVIENKVDTSKSGKYTVKYTVEDSFGNKVSKKREVTVKEKETTTTKTTTTTTAESTTVKPTTTTRVVTTYKTTVRRTTARVTTKVNTTTTRRITSPPTITLVGGDYTMNTGGMYKEPGYSAKDALGNNITARVRVTNNINVTTPGTYNVFYNVTDSYGNSANKIRRVYVKASGSINGITISPSSISLSVNSSYKLIASLSATGTVNRTITWSSSNNGVATVSQDGTVVAKSKGTSTITAKASNGKSATCIVSVR